MFHVGELHFLSWGLLVVQVCPNNFHLNHGACLQKTEYDLNDPQIIQNITAPALSLGRHENSSKKDRMK